MVALDRLDPLDTQALQTAQDVAVPGANLDHLLARQSPGKKVGYNERRARWVEVSLLKACHAEALCVHRHDHMRRRGTRLYSGQEQRQPLQRDRGLRTIVVSHDRRPGRWVGSAASARGGVGSEP